MFRKLLKKLKPKKKDQRVMKKDSVAKVLRIFLWVMLIFLLVRGVIAIVKPDQSQTLIKQMETLETSTKENIEQNSQILSFAENFIREWYTYQGEEEFKARLSPYIVPEILSQPSLHNFVQTSKTEYVNAYRMTQYASNQFDVYVEVVIGNTWIQEVPETTKSNEIAVDEVTEEIEPTAEVKSQQTTTESKRQIKVAVHQIQEGKYIVEGIPLIVNDEAYQPEQYKRVDIEMEKIENVELYQETVTNYLNAYYSEPHSVTEYFLAETNEKELYGFQTPGIVGLAAVKEVKAYRKANKEVLCLVTYQVKDEISQAVSLQQCSIILDDSEAGKFYVKSMDTRLFNLKEGE